MARLILILSVLLMIGSFVVLGFIVQGVDNDRVASALQSLHCNAEETITQTESPNLTGGSAGKIVNFYCELPNGERREVTIRAGLTLAAAFAVPFVTGLLMFIGSVTVMARRRATQWTNNLMGQMTQSGALRQTGQGPTVIHASSGTIDAADLPPETSAMLKKFLGGFDVQVNNVTHDDLADKLEQLKEALNKGLISQSEHDRARQAILDNLAEG